MRNAIPIALLALIGLANVPAEAASTAPRFIVTPRITPQVIDSHTLASRKINILRMRVLSGGPGPSTPTTPPTPSPLPGSTLPGVP